MGSTGPFSFRSGAVAHDVMELGQECDRDWDEGIYHLYNGHFEPWLQGQNRHDLAELLSVVACVVAWIVPVVVILALVVWYVRRK